MDIRRTDLTADTDYRTASNSPASGLVGAVFLLAGILAGTSVVAQSPTDVEAHPGLAMPPADGRTGADDTLLESKTFGTTDSAISTIAWSRFVPADDATGYNSGSFTTARAVDAGAADTQLWAEITAGELPTGANLSQIAFYVNDSDADNNIEAWYCTFEVHSNFGDAYGSICNLIDSTSGTPGSTVIFDTINVTVRRMTDIDSDGTPEIVSHYLMFQPGGDAGPDQKIHMARLVWERQLGPAPGSATFSDVPTGHAFFQHVEALADAGITAGCGGGNYCPNDPVTRGQMAVFLAKALGLHWPS